MASRENPSVQIPNPDRVSIVYSGGMAEQNALILGDYAASLDGWRDLWEILGELYFRSFPELRRIPGASLLRVEIVAEKPGSFTAVVEFVLMAAASGIIGNRADAAAKWGFRGLIGWYRAAITKFVHAKTSTTNVESIADAIEEVSRENEIALGPDGHEAAETPMFVAEVNAEPRDDEPEDEGLGEVGEGARKSRVMAERIDHSLRRATEPIGHSCERISIEISGEPPMLEMGPAERAVIAAPLTVPPPTRDWRKARIKFERINRKTGRALFNFESENARAAPHYSRIIDQSFRTPHNRYTQAFDNDDFIEVWVRQARPEKGRLNTQWEISGANPDEGMLFDLPPNM